MYPGFLTPAGPSARIQGFCKASSAALLALPRAVSPALTPPRLPCTLLGGQGDLCWIPAQLLPQPTTLIPGVWPWSTGPQFCLHRPHPSLTLQIFSSLKGLYFSQL
jgi:hypothetical protein